MSELQASGAIEDVKPKASSGEKSSSPGPLSQDLLRFLVLVAALGIAAFGFLLGATGALLSLLSKHNPASQHSRAHPPVAAPQATIVEGRMGIE